MRRSLSTTARVRIFEAAGGVCHLCKQRIQVGEKWEVEHVVPLALGGADEERNMAPAHKHCHADKTKADNAQWSKAKRQRARHTGAKRSSWPKSKWRRRMDGTVELRR